MTIADARRAYDRGEYEMATGRSDRFEAGRRYVVESLYAIPRRVRRTDRRPMFARVPRV